MLSGDVLAGRVDMRTAAVAALAALAPALALLAAEPFTPVFAVPDSDVTPDVFPELSVFRESIPSYPVNGVSRTARVAVTMKATGETRSVEIRPGDFHLLEF